MPTTWILVATLLLAPRDAETVIPEQPRKATIVATTGPEAIRAGLEVMKRDGTAADAVITTALAQTVLAAGSWVSFAGRMTLVYYEAETGNVYAMNACYDAPREEDDPQSIPRQPTPSGRTVLVPGFMAGIEAMHEKLGKRPFAELFAPAIRLARDGFVLDRGLGGLIGRKREVLTRFPEGRSIFTRDDASLYAAGDLFKQPALAATLEQVAEKGAAFMYTGPWAKRFVAAVRKEGGKLGLEDLAAYRVHWEEPFETEFRGYRIASLNPPNRGGPMAIQGLNLLAEAKLSESGGHYTKSARSLATMLRTERALQLLWSGRGREAIAKHLPDLDLSTRGRWSRPTAKAMWKAMHDGTWPKILEELSPSPRKSEVTDTDHSDSVVAVDRFGNVAAIIHTINTGGWGTTGLFVDGVSIPDSGAFQQGAIAHAGPGGRIIDHGPPLIALKDGKPVLASSATGSGNFTASWQNALNILEFGMSPAESARTPNIYQGAVESRGFSTELIDEARNAFPTLSVVERHSGSQRGYWVGIRIDPESGVSEGGKVPVLNGFALSED